MSLTDGLQLRPIMALQALQEAGVVLTGKVDASPWSDGGVTIEAVWRAPVGYGAGQTGHVPIVVTATAPTLEEASEIVLKRIRQIAGLEEGAALASRVAGTPVQAF